MNEKLHVETTSSGSGRLRAAPLVAGALVIAIISVGLFVFSEVKLAGTSRDLTAAAASCGSCCAGWKPQEMPPEAASALRPALAGPAPSASHDAGERGGSK